MSCDAREEATKEPLDPDYLAREEMRKPFLGGDEGMLTAQRCASVDDGRRRRRVGRERGEKLPRGRSLPLFACHEQHSRFTFFLSSQRTPSL